MDAQNWNIKCPTDRVSHASACQEGTSEARAFGNGNGINIGTRFACFDKYFVNKGNGTSNVVAAGELRHHATIGTVHVDLGIKGICEEAILIRNKGSSRLVAGGFNTEN